MPFKITLEQEAFKLELADGLPVAPITKLGAMHYMLVCPLCGCMEEVGQVSQGVILGNTLKPRCTVKPPHPITLAKWLQKHPEAAQHTTVKLMQPIPDEQIISNPQPKRKAA